MLRRGEGQAFIGSFAQDNFIQTPEHLVHAKKKRLPGLINRKWYCSFIMLVLIANAASKTVETNDLGCTASMYMPQNRGSPTIWRQLGLRVDFVFCFNTCPVILYLERLRNSVFMSDQWRAVRALYGRCFDIPLKYTLWRNNYFFFFFSRELVGVRGPRYKAHG